MHLELDGKAAVVMGIFETTTTAFGISHVCTQLCRFFVVEVFVIRHKKIVAVTVKVLVTQ